MMMGKREVKSERRYTEGRQEKVITIDPANAT